MDHGLSASNILQTFPIALQGDASVAALASAIADLLAARPAEIDLLRIYPEIDRLPEKLLDILAYDFKVDWWDGDYSLEQKRQVFKDSFLVHKRLGTPWAVSTALQVAFPGAVAQEWFEYEGGEPYHFRVDVPVTGAGPTEQQQRRGISRVWWYKNLRSHWDEIEYHMPERDTIIGMAFRQGIQVTMPVPEQPDDLSAETNVRLGGSVSGTIAVLPVPEQSDDLSAETILRAGGGGALTARLPQMSEQG